MTSMPMTVERRLSLVIDLDICVVCHTCAVNCRSWHSTGAFTPPSDTDPYGSEVSGTWLNRIHSFKIDEDEGGCTVHFPGSCLHRDNAPCVPVCPTGAFYKRAADGIVLVDEDLGVGCGLCAWACGAHVSGPGRLPFIEIGAWRATREGHTTAASTLGLEGRVRGTHILESPSTSGTRLQREMVFAVARRHA